MSGIRWLGRRILRGMSALTDDELDPRPVPGWHLPTDLEGFLSVLRRSATLGSTDHTRVQRFIESSPAWKYAPAGLVDDLRRAELID